MFSLVLRVLIVFGFGVGVFVALRFVGLDFSVVDLAVMVIVWC